jgi:hypothetical protein
MQRKRKRNTQRLSVVVMMICLWEAATGNKVRNKEGCSTQRLPVCRGHHELPLGSSKGHMQQQSEKGKYNATQSLPVVVR